MSVPTTIPELASGEATDLFDHYKTGQIGPSEELELFELIHSVAEKYEKKFKLAEVLKSSFDYTAFEVKRLDSEYHKWLKRQIKEDSPSLEPQGPASPAIMQKAKEVGTGASKAMFGEIQEIGNLLVLEFTPKAAARGEPLKEYVLKSIEIRETYGDHMEELQQENEQLKVLCSMFSEVVKPQFKQLAASRIYLDWTTGLMQLQAMGYAPNQKWVDEVTEKIEAAMGVKIF
jgi:hypothetical protein